MFSEIYVFAKRFMANYISRWLVGLDDGASYDIYNDAAVGGCTCASPLGRQKAL